MLFVSRLCLISRYSFQNSETNRKSPNLTPPLIRHLALVLPATALTDHFVLFDICIITAYRLTSGDPMIQHIDVPTGPDGGTAESEYTPPSTQGKGFGNVGEEKKGDGNGGIVEGCGDGGDPGAGDKLLHLLRRWDIQNVVLCVTCWDDGLRGRLGSRRFRLYLDSAKSVLEQCYMDSMSVASSAGGDGAGGAGKDSKDSMVGGSGDSIEDQDGVRSSSSSSSGVATSSDMVSSASARSRGGGSQKIETENGGWSDHAVRIPSAEGKYSGNNNQDEMEQQQQPQQRSQQQEKQVRLPRGTDLLRTYRQARARFMPERPRFRGLKHSVVDASAANIPQGEPDGLGGFGLDPKRKMGRVNHFLAAAPIIGESSSSSSGQAGFMELGMQGSSEYGGNPSSAGGSSSAAYSTSTQGGGGGGGGGDYPASRAYPLIRIPMPSITRAQLEEAKSVVRPHELTHCVYRCVALLLGYRDTTWPGCREMLASPNFVREIVLLQPLSIPFDEISAVRDLLEELGPGFNPGNLQRQSILAADMLEWCIRVVRAYYDVTASARGSAGHEGGGGGGFGLDADFEDYEDEHELGDGEYEDEGDRRKGYEGKHQGRREGRQEAGQIVYVKGEPRQSLPVRMLRMDPNPDYGKEGPAKSPITAPLHMRNDVGPQPIRSVGGGEGSSSGRQLHRSRVNAGGGSGRNGTRQSSGQRRTEQSARSARSARSGIGGWHSRGASKQLSRRATQRNSHSNGVRGEEEEEGLAVVSNGAMQVSRGSMEGSVPVRKW